MHSFELKHEIVQLPNLPCHAAKLQQQRLSTVSYTPAMYVTHKTKSELNEI